MKIDYSLWRSVAKRVAEEIWIPALFALIATAYGYWKTPSGIALSISQRGIFSTLGDFFTTLFFFGAFFAYFLRARKLVVDERNHEKVLGKQEDLILRLEQVATELTGHTNGGDGYCHIWFVQHDGQFIKEIQVSVESKYVLQDVRLRLSTFEAANERSNEAALTQNRDLMFASDFFCAFPSMQPRTVYSQPCKISIPNSKKIRLHVNFEAKNGRWYQRIQMELSGLFWQMATYVTREENEIFRKIEPGYPLDAEGKAIFNEQLEKVSSDAP